MPITKKKKYTFAWTDDAHQEYILNEFEESSGGYNYNAAGVWHPSTTKSFKFRSAFKGNKASTGLELVTLGSTLRRPSQRRSARIALLTLPQFTTESMQVMWHQTTECVPASVVEFQMNENAASCTCSACSLGTLSWRPGSMCGADHLID